jgi:hypothetical protein
MATKSEFVTSPLLSLSDYIEVARSNYESCIQEISHNIKLEMPVAELHLKYVKFDGNGNPKFDNLVDSLYEHIINYCIAARARPKSLTAQDAARFVKQARDLFRNTSMSGEVGELLLFFILEAAFKAPQLVCKMGLKTNPNEEVKGADAIHASWDENKNILNIFIGEAKLYGDLASGIRAAHESIAKLIDERAKVQHEVYLVGNNFKFADENLRTALLDVLENRNPKVEVRFVQACLIGFDWPKFSMLSGSERQIFIDGIENLLKTEGDHIKSLVDKNFETLKGKSFAFEFIFIPFEKVEEFRKKFFDVLRPQ